MPPDDLDWDTFYANQPNATELFTLLEQLEPINTGILAQSILGRLSPLNLPGMVVKGKDIL